MHRLLIKSLKSFSYIGVNENYSQLNEIDKIASASLPIQIHQTEFVELESGAIPKRSSIKKEEDSKVNLNDCL